MAALFRCEMSSFEPSAWWEIELDGIGNVDVFKFIESLERIGTDRWGDRGENPTDRHLNVIMRALLRGVFAN